MMKFYKLIWMSVVAVLLWTSCYDDKGNYDYTEINQISAEHAFFDSTVHLTSFKDTLRVSPEISGSLINDPDNYSYEWVLSSSAVTGGVADTIYIGNTLNLEYPLSLSAGVYTVYLKTLDKTTGLTDISYFTLRLTTDFSQGWLVLGEGDDGRSQLDMISTVGEDTLVLKNLLAQAEVDMGKPVGVFVPPYRPVAALNQILLSTDNGTYRLNPSTMQPITASHLKWAFYDYNAAGDCIMADAMQVMGYIRCIILDGRLFYNTLMGSTGYYLDLPTNHYQGKDELFPIGDVIGTGEKERSQTVVVYNTEKGCFASQSNAYAPYFRDLPDVTGDVFSWKPGPDYKFVTTINTRFSNGFTYTILKNGGDYYLYSYRISSYYGVIKQTRVKMDNLIDFDKAEFFGGSGMQPIIFYTVGNKLYGYNYAKKQCDLLRTFDGLEITMLKHDIVAEPYSDNFYIGLYDPNKPLSTGGSIQKFAVEDDVNNTIVSEVERSCWTNLCKVKSISYKQR